MPKTPKRSSKRRKAKTGAIKSAKKISFGKKSPTKSLINAHLAEVAELPKSQVAQIMNNLGELIEAALRGPGNFTLAGVAKFRVVRKPATKARKGINPFTGEPTTFKAKPARNVVKIRPLKRLKDAVQ